MDGFNEKEENEILVICGEYNKGDEDTYLPDFLKCNCKDCNREIVFTDSTRRSIIKTCPTIKEKDYLLLCFECSNKYAGENKEGNSIDVIALSEEQINEIATALNISKKEVELLHEKMEVDIKNKKLGHGWKK